MKIIFLLAVILLVGFSPQIIEAYKMEIIWYWSNQTPVVCIWDSDYNEVMVKSMIEWNNFFRDKWGENDTIPFYIVNGTTLNLENCNIHLIMVPLEVTRTDPSNDVYNNPLGRASPDLRNEIIWLHIFEERTINDELYIMSIKRTIMHELGHGWGLGHIVPENMHEGLKPHPNTLMWVWQWGQEIIIDEATKKGIDCIYGKDGWAGKNDRCPEWIRVPLIKPNSTLTFGVNFS